MISNCSRLENPGHREIISCVRAGIRRGESIQKQRARAPPGEHLFIAFVTRNRFIQVRARERRFFRSPACN